MDTILVQKNYTNYTNKSDLFSVNRMGHHRRRAMDRRPHQIQAMAQGNANGTMQPIR